MYGPMYDKIITSIFISGGPLSIKKVNNPFMKIWLHKKEWRFGSTSPSVGAS